MKPIHLFLDTNGSKGPKARKPWSPMETKAVVSHLRSNLNNCKLPGKKDCEACIKSNLSVLKDRSWKDIKYFSKNYISKARKMKDSH